MGQIVTYDYPLNRKEAVQGVKIRFDVRDRVRSWLLFHAAPGLAAELLLDFDKFRGFCRLCGLFVHDATCCDEFLVKEKEELLEELGL